MVFGGRWARVQQCRRLPGNGLQPMAQGGVGEAVQPAVENRTGGNDMQRVDWAPLQGEKVPDARVSRGVGVRVALQHRVDDVVRQIPLALAARPFPNGQVDPGQIAAGVLLQGSDQQRDLIPPAQPELLSGAEGPGFVFQAARGQDPLQPGLAELQDPFDTVAAVQVGIFHPRFHSHRQILRRAPADPHPLLPGRIHHYRPGRNPARDLPDSIPGVRHQIGGFLIGRRRRLRKRRAPAVEVGCFLEVFHGLGQGPVQSRSPRPDSQIAGPTPQQIRVQSFLTSQGIQSRQRSRANQPRRRPKVVVAAGKGFSQGLFQSPGHQRQVSQQDRRQVARPGLIAVDGYGLALEAGALPHQIVTVAAVSGVAGPEVERGRFTLLGSLQGNGETLLPDQGRYRLQPPIQMADTVEPPQGLIPTLDLRHQLSRVPRRERAPA